MMYHEIGETFTVRKDTFKVVEDRSFNCELCDLEFMEELCSNRACSIDERKDSTSVSFILLDSEEPDEFDLTGEFND